jgi:hypothetical protein
MKNAMRYPRIAFSSANAYFDPVQYFSAMRLTVSLPRNVDGCFKVFSRTAFENFESLCFWRQSQ